MIETRLHHLSTFEMLDDFFRQWETDLLLVISEATVWSLYGERFQELLKQQKNKKILLWIGPSGEAIKTLEQYSSCVEYFLNAGVHSRAQVVAIGGGALSDFAGLVAATLLRGLSWNVIPTTLLSMVDASIGGKVAVNAMAGKNLIGTYHHPRQVLIHAGFLATLPLREVQSGHGEILKYSFLNKKIHEEIETSGPAIVSLCSSFKLNIVKTDEKDHGERLMLNLGHTFGHALEKMLPISHGEAVVLGLEIILKYFVEDPALMKTFERQKKLLGLGGHLGDWKNSLDKKRLLSYVFKDKKMCELNRLRLVLLKDVGQPFILVKSFQEVEAIVGSMDL